MENSASMSDQFLTLVHQIINENLDNEFFSVEDLATKAGLSRSMLHRKLVKLTGKSATDLIMEIRLTKAKELLEGDVATVSEIAYKVGFNSVSYFHRTFKKRFNVSPGDIKKQAVNSQYQKKDEKLPEKNTSNKSTFPRKFILALIVLLVVLIAAGVVFNKFKTRNTDEKSIAILPFDNISPDPDNQYIADGIVEDLLNRLSKLNNLKVISRTSSEIFRNKGDKTVPEIADFLGVKYVLEGSVQRESNNIRISIQLIDAKKDNHILSKQYDRNLSEIFKFQSEIAREIISELSIALSDQQLIDLQDNQIHNLDAFNYYQMGRYHFCRCSKEESLASIEYYKRAIKADSNYASAYVGMAEAYRAMYTDGWIAKEGAIRDTAVYYARKALEIDKNNAEAHTVLATVYYAIDFNMKAAENEFLKAIEINSNNSLTYKEYAKFLCLTGKPERAREFMNQAISIDPFSFTIRHNSTVMYYAEGNYKKALEENQICLDIVKNHPYAVDIKFWINFKLKNEQATLESFKKTGAISGEYTEQQADSAYRKEGIDGLLRLFAKTGKWPAGRAQCYVLLGDNEKAIKTLETALENNMLSPWDLFQTDTKNIESDPRFKVIEKKLGLNFY